jgi:hypothetical protein
MTQASKQLKLARWHLQQTESRLTCQEAVVAGMERSNRTVGLKLGRRLVETLRESLRLARAHVERLERGASNFWRRA